MRSIFIICLLLLINDAVAKEQWLLVSHSSKPSIFAQGDMLQLDKPEPLRLDASADRSSPESLLSKYYALLKAQDIKAVEKLYSNKDGSRDKFSMLITNKKLKLTRYSQLSGVSIAEKFTWGPYSYFSVKLKNDSGRTASWNEKVVCEKSCSMVFNMLETTPESRIVDSARVTYWASTDLNGDLTGKLKPSQSTFKVSLLPPSSSLYSGQKVPLDLFINLKRESTEFVFTDVSCKKTEDKRLIELCYMHQLVNTMDFSNPEETKQLFNRFWGVDEPKATRFNTVEKSEVVGRYHTPLALANIVESWSGVKLVGSFENLNTHFVLIKPLSSDAVLNSSESVKKENASTQIPLQLLTFKHQNGELMLDLAGNYEDIVDLFNNGIFVKKLELALNGKK